ncbi:hypothetical protein C8R45DRAFT_938980 [Mycena sanguinolenta]|nr:hypothetical protein C8R45DRAFT_938980 [Mycena sanguinolenta]
MFKVPVLAVVVYGGQTLLRIAAVLSGDIDETPLRVAERQDDLDDKQQGRTKQTREDDKPTRGQIGQSICRTRSYSSANTNPGPAHEQTDRQTPDGKEAGVVVKIATYKKAWAFSRVSAVYCKPPAFNVGEQNMACVRGGCQSVAGIVRRRRVCANTYQLVPALYNAEFSNMRT